MNGSPTIGWSIQNLITVTLMVLLTFAVVGLGYRVFASMTAPKTQPAPAGEVGTLS